MTRSDLLQIMAFFSLLFILSFPLGIYCAKVFMDKNKNPFIFFYSLEKLIYKICYIDENDSMSAKKYISCILFLSFFGFIFTFLAQIYQSHLPLNPMNIKDVPWALAFNTAISFVTNTNWQSYSGESTLSFFSQTLALNVQNFLSAAIGICVLIAFSRSFKKNQTSLGNFWQDLIKSIIYILLPLSIILAIILVSCGVIQNFSLPIKVVTFEGLEQIIPTGPVASQVAIKQLGTNGGGFFGTNSAHPFENPNSLSNFFQMLSILLLPSALVITFGLLINARRHALMLFYVMFTLVVSFSILSYLSEDQLLYPLEGKELRFGIVNSILWSVATTAASNGSINAMLDSLSPLSGGIALFQILLGEVIFGGIGSGLYGMILFVILTIFLSGLMIGRSPSYLGKKIEKQEILLVLVALLLPSAVVLFGSSLSVIMPIGTSSILNKGPHGLSEILYAWGSTANNNGSAFSGLDTNNNFYNIGLALSMLLGRFGVIIPVLLIAQSFSKKETLADSTSNLPTHTFLFAILLVAIIILIGSLTFIPALALGPILEHFLMKANINF